jgi:hypothetical protein
MTECDHQAGAECLFSCDAGYRLKGSSVRRCTAAGWTGQITLCQGLALLDIPEKYYTTIEVFQYIT